MATPQAWLVVAVSATTAIFASDNPMEVKVFRCFVSRVFQLVPRNAIFKCPAERTLLWSMFGSRSQIVCAADNLASEGKEPRLHCSWQVVCFWGLLVLFMFRFGGCKKPYIFLRADPVWVLKYLRRLQSSHWSCAHQVCGACSPTPARRRPRQGIGWVLVSLFLVGTLCWLVLEGIFGRSHHFRGGSQKHTTF